MELRDYQIRIVENGCEVLSKYKILYLAMQTRTGKTLTALSIIERAGFKSCLFVTKKKAIKSIETDYAAGSFTFSITVINYESVHLVNGSFDILVCDEAHSLSAYPKPALRVKNLLAKAKLKPIIYLSATPSPESWSQLYHQFYLSLYSPFIQYRNFYQWARAFVTVQKKYVYNREINDYSNANKEAIWQQVKHLFITQTQEASGFSVEVQERILTVPMPAGLKAIIARIMKHNIFQDGSLSIVADTAVKVMQKVHQLSSGTIIDDNGYHVVDTFKADYLLKWSDGRKLVVFYKFKSEFEMLKLAFENWTDDAFDFQQSTNKIFLGQFVSAREGIRLDTADAIVFFNIDFSFLSLEQARNRIASFERKETAILYWLFSDAGIEKRIYKAVKNKSDYTLKYFQNERISIRTELEQEGDQTRLDLY